MKIIQILTGLLLFTTSIIAQKLYDYKNEVYLNLADMPKVQYIKVHRQNWRSKNEKSNSKADSDSIKEKAIVDEMPKGVLLSYFVDFGQKKPFPLSDFTNTNSVDLCNYLYESGWELVTVASDVTGLESSSTQMFYIFKRRSK